MIPMIDSDSPGNFPPNTAHTTHLFGNYGRFDRAFLRGEGCWLIDEFGVRHLDAAAGIAVNSLGHAHPTLVAALRDQADMLWHCSNLYHIRSQEGLADRLCALSFAEHVLVCNSGVEAIEGMLKLARRWHFERGNPQRQRVITLDGAFHGRSLATISAVNDPKLTHGFGQLLDGFRALPAAADRAALLSAVEEAIAEDTAAIMLEPIQGEGGIVDLIDLLPDLRKLADDHGILLLLDEIQCGVGRTGKLYAHEWAGIVPDALATAKGLGGGFPIGAILAGGHMLDGLPAGSHGTTFGGNPLGCTVANAVLDEVADPLFLAKVETQGILLAQALRDFAAKYPDRLLEQRGRGLMQGMRLNPEWKSSIDAVRWLLEAGVLTVPARDNIVRLLPPLIVLPAEIELLIGKIETMLTEA